MLPYFDYKSNYENNLIVHAAQSYGVKFNGIPAGNLEDLVVHSSYKKYHMVMWIIHFK